ncbi:hypothetical protein [Glutamicibacter sp. FBE19]|uniref:hypothetical protein n=1 Tax=Glutamicibacter sp. FBE19 TaxID=2761534 RepID=UPI00189660A4|nr:hypothetical protein [Glutamicibacter sp. FBE19]MBF6672456.1 hypothetical protein [Glutamicibacter sp. FBE19]
MVIASVCPEHGPFGSAMYVIENSTNVTLDANGDKCPVPGCTSHAKVMDGNYSFGENEVIIHQAPEWSVRALASVTSALGHAIRVAANPESSDANVAAAFEQAALLTRMNLSSAPAPFREQIANILPIKFGKGTRGSRKAVIIALSTVVFLLTNYSSVKDNVAEMIADGQAVKETVIEVIDDLSDQVIAQLHEAFADTESE